MVCGGQQKQTHTHGCVYADTNRDREARSHSESFVSVPFEGMMPWARASCIGAHGSRAGDRRSGDSPQTKGASCWQVIRPSPARSTGGREARTCLYCTCSGLVRRTRCCSCFCKPYGCTYAGTRIASTERSWQEM